MRQNPLVLVIWTGSNPLELITGPERQQEKGLNGIVSANRLTGPVILLATEDVFGYATQECES